MKKHLKIALLVEEESCGDYKLYTTVSGR